MADAVKRNAVAQSKLIRDLLDLSRLRSGKLELNRETVSPVTSIENAIETVRIDAESKEITIEVTSPEDLLFVQADPVRLEQIIWNLLNNSVKFTPKGGRITVRLEEDANQIVLTVSDNGQGIRLLRFCRTYSRFSGRPTPARTARKLAWGSVWRWCSNSLSCTAVRSVLIPVARARARRLRFGCREVLRENRRCGVTGA